ncbi:MAG: hypothetical protein QNK05_07125 [Myxococcota bacterium]|nr:hypothetical protein [Myxococcota bacterium]
MTERKDRLVQARVPETLETSLKNEARRRRTTVSQMIRDILEDTFQLVDGVVANVDQLVTDSARLAGRVADAAGETRRRLESPRCGPATPESKEVLAGVLAWNEVVLNQSAPCARCAAELPRGSRAYLGLSAEAGAPRTWLCPRAVAALRDDPETAPEPQEETE